MDTFTNLAKSSQSSFTTTSKDTDTWTNLSHSDVLGFGFNVQTFDSATTGFDDAGNIIQTTWTTTPKD